MGRRHLIQWLQHWITAKFTSPPWAVGYYFEIETDNGDYSNLYTTLWWDGWKGGIYCNDLHFHIKSFAYKLSFKKDIIWNAECNFPL
ncbi:hypothetical protein F8M41_005757 [Gigaspora margarita]|uniref:Uncharacterized protein n=1 Tax=Gigaspora margarita TaxID=4874 RepID=A0A8H3X8E4_GIGMA|nr:hypothetical protein F8M41_005757 [Gigaspora margarita]